MAIPPTSPRLPSPPPAAEIQIGPKSPAASGAELAQQQMEQQMEQSIFDANSKRRIRRGTRAADFAVGPPLVPLNELDSAFQFQEHLAALHYHHTGNNTVPVSRDTALLLAQAPPGADRTMWLYELCRFLIAQCNSLIVGFLFDTPACSATTCPEMRASEWQFLCAVHEQPRSCCAIDYCCHTLDWAANVVTNPKIFPSRFAFADPHDKNAAVKNLINVFRRLHRIFAHAWFQHRGVFWSVEAQKGLYVFFKTVCDIYDLLPAENYKLPPEAEGLNTAASPTTGARATDATEASTESAAPGLISVSAIGDKSGLGFNPSSPGPAGDRATQRLGSGPVANDAGSTSGTGLAADLFGNDAQHLHSIGRTNTRRHIRSSPSTGSAVTTVMEQDEDLSSSTLPSTAAVRPVSILQNSHVALSRSHTPPVVTETEILEDENEAAGNTSGGQASALNPTSVDTVQHHHAPAVSDEQGPQSQDSPLAEVTTSSDAPTPASEESSRASVELTEGKQEEEEPTEPVTIIVAGDKLPQADCHAVTAADTQLESAEDEPSIVTGDSDAPEVADASDPEQDTDEDDTSESDDEESTNDSASAPATADDATTASKVPSQAQAAAEEHIVRQTETNDVQEEEAGDDSDTSD
ncbi:hypothetical protein SEPCBS119000_005798 [Sporothrix epigloea]|uniref:Mob1 family protein n=1 Tax=Sporothrix epigloea TaxID=1892477 RepID=A0ABP0DZH5_9PEZI